MKLIRFFNWWIPQFDSTGYITMAAGFIFAFIVMIALTSIFTIYVTAIPLAFVIIAFVATIWSEWGKFVEYEDVVSLKIIARLKGMK